MTSRKSRRGFLGLVGAAASSALAVSRAAAAEADKKTYAGVSKNGDLQEALNNALKAALKDQPKGAGQVAWTLKELSGHVNGANDVTMTIEASFS